MAKEAVARQRHGWRRIGRMFGWGMAALLLLALHLFGPPWTPPDLILASLLLGMIGLGLEFIFHRPGLPYRLGAALAAVAALLTFWVNGGVGMIGSEDNGYNLLFLGVPAVALVGAVLARLRPAGLAWAMLAAAAAQVVLGAGGLPADLRGGIFSMAFGALWVLAAAAFRKAGGARG